MAKFVASKAVERIEWDFTGVPHVGADVDDREPKTVTGDHVIGVLPEPDPDTAARFAEAHVHLIEDALKARQATVSRLVAAQAGDDDIDPQEITAEVMSSADAYLAQYEQALAALRIVGVPGDLLEQLPPRYVGAFMAHVANELQGEGDAA